MFQILIAEDDPSTARLLSAILKRDGYTPLLAADGVEALEMLDHNQVDLLLCDVMMPHMDGFALTKAIRDSGSMLPILMLTARDLPADKHTGFIVGTDDYMTKPPDRQELLLRIRALLRRARIVDEHKIVVGALSLTMIPTPCAAATTPRSCRPRSLTFCTSCWPTRSGHLPGWSCWTRFGAWTAKVTIRR